MISLPQEYIISKVLESTKRPIRLKHRNAYNFECPICNEGKSAGKKRRGFYMPEEGYIYCHNCTQGWDPVNWIQQVCGLSFKEIMQESSTYEDSVDTILVSHTSNKPKTTFGTLPDNSINLCDPLQVSYYKDNKVVNLCLREIERRRLNTAINRPKSFWVSLEDKVHANRLVIPFYDEDNQIRFYQTRTILTEDMADKPKYLSKLNADKRIYGMNAIDSNINQLFIFEGPIDSMFVKNGIAVCGLHMTDLQQDILNKYFLYELIWVPDNQFIDDAAKQKTMQLIDQGAKVFIWPKEVKKYKDINDICVNYQLDRVSPKFITDNSYRGTEATIRLNLS